MTDADEGNGNAQPSEHEAIEALEHLGLSNYAARVFVALQRLGVGTAKEIHDVAGVPRSQVYGAAEELESLGLVELQQSTPKRYRSVSLDAAHRCLAENLQNEANRAFNYLEAARAERTAGETRDDVWTIRGHEPVNNRVIELVEQSQERVLFAAPSLLFVTDDLVKALRERAANNVDVRVVSESADVRDRFETVPDVSASGPDEEPPVDFTGRVLLVDRRVVLLSVVPNVPGSDETAIWSADTAMADILSQIIEGGIESMIGF
ncbi:TrmB family transcriptional regulator [Halogeometricum borinquense]|uniref:TrmB family transcriptional regulator n=1 Tax=Halogeometricum borinquense TaxID=60847 RepID=A0A6C0UFY3_9EURY|nr:TrmB family transcriptional regulator [Halogeometricum borinquense]QIB74130.1 TrmB family transcriptional regulator [Halogeometricum borinquense]QIQ76662.1 TrmB family transcriptional regulator [Halogeometricum borinquense]